MENENKKSLSYKIQKNPFLIGLALIIAILVLTAVFSLSSAVKKKIARENETTAVTTTEAVVSTTSAPDTTVELQDLKTYDDNIKTTKVEYTAAEAIITVEFKDNQSLLDSHYAETPESIKISPVFHFFINHGTEVKCPGKIRLLDDGKTMQYILTEINDLKNVVALTDGITLDYKNAFTMSFDLYIEYTGNGDGTVGKTLLGTYAKTVEQLKDESRTETAKYSNAAKGIKSVELVSSEKFAWLDIYFTDQKSYDSLNFSFDNNFVGMKFEMGGKKYDTLFTATYYDDIKMVRCKFDSYAAAQLSKKTSKNITVTSIFSEKLTIFSSDYDNDKTLFTLN